MPPLRNFILFIQGTCVIRVMATPVLGIPSYFIFPTCFNGVKFDVALLTEGFHCGCSKAVFSRKYFDPPNVLLKFKSGGCYAVSEGFLSAGEYDVLVAP